MPKKMPKVRDQDRKGFAGADYNHVALNAKLRLISLASSRFDVKADCVAERKNWRLSYDWNEVVCRYDEASNSVSALFAYEVTAKLGRKTAMRCTAEYAVMYMVPGDSEAEAAEGYCHNIGAFAAYPYFRALVAQFAASANLVLPPLPAIASTAHVPKKVEGKTIDHE